MCRLDTNPGGGAICDLEGRRLGPTLLGGSRKGSAIVGSSTTGVGHCEGAIHSG